MKKRICFCINNLKIGGAERLLVDIINFWDITDWQIYLCCLKPQNQFGNKLNWKKVTKYTCLKTVSNLKLIMEAFWYCKKNKIHIVNTHLERANKWFGLGAWMAGARVVASIHSTDLFDSSPAYKFFIYKSIYNLIPKRIVAVSNTVKDYLVRLGIRRDRIEIIENGIDIRTISARYSLASKINSLALVFVGRLEYQKGLDILIDALALIDRNMHNWSLDVIGDGSSLENLKKKIKELGLLNHIYFHGTCDDPLALLVNKSLFCMPSRREGLPLSLLEALAMGLPAIVSNVGYLPILIRHGFNGLVCDKESPEDLARKILQFLNMTQGKRRKLQINAKKSVVYYDIRRCSKHYQYLCHSLFQ